MTKLKGFDGILYYGTAGSTAATELTIARDVSYNFAPDEADVSDRASIINLKDVAGISFSLEFEINNDNANAAVAALRTAAATGGAIALRTLDESGGYGVDADFVIGLDESQPLRDADRIKVTAMPTDKSGRTPTFA